MIKGIGVDIIDIKRFATVQNKEVFLKQTFTADEIKNGKHMHDKNKYWARLFAIKEALLKTLKIGLRTGTHWHDIHISKDFVVTLSGYFKEPLNKKTKIFVAHSCSKRYAASITFIQD